MPSSGTSARLLEMFDPLLTVVDASNYLVCSIRYIWRLVEKGELPSYRLGGITRFKLEDLQEYVDTRREG